MLLVAAVLSLLALTTGLSAQDGADADGHVEWRVRVVDVEGRPLSAVSICATPPASGAGTMAAEAILEAADAVTDADGRASWRARPSASAWIAAPGRIPLMVAQADVAEWEGVIDLGRLVLHLGRPLVAIVRGPDGKGIEGVSAYLSPAGPTEYLRPSIRPHLVGSSDASGVVKIPAVPDGAFDLSLGHDDYLGQRVPCVTPRSPLDITLDPGALVTGRVVVAEGLLPRVWAQARTEVGSRSGDVDDDGRFAIRVPSGLRYRLVLQGGREQELVGPIRKGPASGIEWTAPTSVRELEIRCQNAVGDPVEAFVARASWSEDHEGLHASMALRLHGAVASENGRARLPIDREWLPGHGVLRVRADGYGETFVPVDAPPEGEDPAPVVATLEPEVVVQGKVSRSDTREPLAGVQVWATPNPIGRVGYPLPSDVAVLSDDEGHYRLGHLARGTWTLNLHRPGWLRPHSVELQLDPETQPVVTMDDVALAPPDRVRAQVVGLEDPERWFVDQRVVPEQGLGFQPPGSSWVRQAAAMVEPSEWLTATGVVDVSVFTASGGTNPYTIRRPARWDRGEDGIVRIRVEDGYVCRVSGRWRTDDYAFVERLGVRALPLASGGQSSGGASEVRADGSWGFDVAPGEYALSVIDLATGVELWRGEPLTVLRDEGDIAIDPRFQIVALAYEGAGGAEPALARRGGQLVVGESTHYVAQGLDTLLLPPRPVKFVKHGTPPGQLNTTSIYRLECEAVESTWEPGTERWVVRVPAPLGDEELLGPARRSAR